MVEVRLLTRDGKLVTTVHMPPFQLWPEGVLWGQRFFRCGPTEDEFGVKYVPAYYEGLLWVCPPENVAANP